MQNANDFMLYFNLLIGIYLTYAGITGKGKAYSNDYPKEIKADVDKMNRLMFLIVGPVMTVFGALELFKITIFTWFTIIFVLVAIVVYLIIFYRRFGKAIKEYRKKKF